MTFGGTNNDQIFITANTSLYGITRKPDLVLTALQLLPANARPGQEVRFLCVVKKPGSARPQAGSYRVTFRSAARRTILKRTAALAADASILLTIPNEQSTPWKAISGANRIYAVADFESRLVESNERNNDQYRGDKCCAFARHGWRRLSRCGQVTGTDPTAASSVLKILSAGLSPTTRSSCNGPGRPGV